MDHHLTQSDDMDDLDDVNTVGDNLAPMSEIEFAEWEETDTAAEVELLLGQGRATRFAGA